MGVPGPNQEGGLGGTRGHAERWIPSFSLVRTASELKKDSARICDMPSDLSVSWKLPTLTKG